MAMIDEEWNVRAGAAALATCLVKTIEQSDPTFQERFLKTWTTPTITLKTTQRP